MRLIDVKDMENIALGSAVLGTGGGGDPYVGKVWAESTLKRYGPVKLIEVDDLDDDDLVVPVAMMGAPTVLVEKLPNGEECVQALKALEAYLQKPVKAVMCIEAGGINSTIPFSVASRLGLPLLDADGMGRAFPELQMVLLTLHGITATPMVMADEKGNNALINTIDNRWTERFARSLVVDMGGSSNVCLYPLTGKQAKQSVLRGTLSLIEEIGKAIHDARANKQDPIQAVLGVTKGYRVFHGKVTDVLRRTEGGFARGETTLSGIEGDLGHSLRVHFQNEFLAAYRDDRPVVTTPDLIAMLDSETGEPITTEALRYGFRVAVIGIPCAPAWRTPAGLELAGPRYFKYDTDYVPLEQTLAVAR